jgi:hypothetical protein
MLRNFKGVNQHVTLFVAQVELLFLSKNARVIISWYTVDGGRFPVRLLARSHSTPNMLWFLGQVKPQTVRWNVEKLERVIGLTLIRAAGGVYDFRNFEQI